MQELNKTLVKGVRAATRSTTGDLVWPSYRSPAGADVGLAAGEFVVCGSDSCEVLHITIC